MSRRSFTKLCHLLKDLGKKNCNARETISLEKRVAIGLYTLGSSSEYRTIGHVFGVAKCTVCKIFLEFITEVWKVLFPLHMNYMPFTSERVEECLRGFTQLGFPQCIGAIDGCHIEVRPKRNDAVDYYNYKGWYSTVLLALVDAKYRFLYINVGSPGRCNDSQIYEKSILKRELQNSTVLKEKGRMINGVNVGVFIIADSAFRFSPTLMKPFPFSIENSESRRTFNYNLSKVRRVIENAFGHIKARFRRVGKGIDNKIENANAVIKACCILHNFLIEENEQLPSSWLQEEQRRERRNPPQYRTNIANERQTADMYREALCSYFEDVGDGDGDSATDGNGDGNGDGAADANGDDNGDGNEDGDGLVNDNGYGLADGE